MTSLRCIISTLCLMPLLGCAAPTSTAPDVLLTSSATSLARFMPEDLPSESWRRAHHALEQQEWAPTSTSMHALFAAALAYSGRGELSHMYDVYVYEKIQHVSKSGEGRQALQSTYEATRRALRAGLAGVTPAQFGSMNAAERRAALSPTFRELAFIDPVAAALMRPSSQTPRAGSTMGDEQVDGLIVRFREQIARGQTDAASVGLMMHEPDVDELLGRSLNQWLDARAAWHGMWRALGEHELIARHLTSPVVSTRPLSTSERITIAAWRCQEWLLIARDEPALEACQLAIDLHPERFRRPPTLSTHTDHLSGELVAHATTAAAHLGQYQLAERYASWHTDPPQRERLHAMIFEQMMAREAHASAVIFAREFLDDRDVLIAIARQAQARPDDPEAERERALLWTQLADQPGLGELASGEVLANQIGRLLDFARLTRIYPEIEPIISEHIIEAIDRLHVEQDRVRGYVILARAFGPEHEARVNLMEVLREELLEYAGLKNAQGIAMLRKSDHALFGELIEHASGDAELVSLLLGQLENASDAGEVLGHITRAEGLRVMPAEALAVARARLLDLPMLHSPAEYVVIGAQLLRLCDDLDAWAQVEAHIFARRSDEVSAEPLRALYASWFERKLVLGADLGAMIATIEDKTYPEERDVMSAAIVDVLYDRVWLPQELTLEQLERMHGWRTDARRGVIYHAKLATLRARQSRCEHVFEGESPDLVGFPPALLVLIDVCRDELPAQSWHGWLQTREPDRSRFARELAFALIYET